ncbi:hypothetical protein I3760_06G164100 [Carya illinoinensis]|nr:hypothetical protein I3760_06G164100 [Carya illinoinensis]
MLITQLYFNSLFVTIPRTASYLCHFLPLFLSGDSLSLSLSLIYIAEPLSKIPVHETSKELPMDPCSFVRILVGNLAVKFAVASKPSFSVVHPSTSPCFCKIKLDKFLTQYSNVPLVAQESQTNSLDCSLAASFTLNKTHIDKLMEKGRNPVLQIAVYLGRRGTTCGFNSGKLLGKVAVEVDLRAVETRASNIHQGWVAIGGNEKKGSSAQLYVSVRAEPDPRYVFQFDGEPECSPQVFQVHGDVRQPVFSCKFGFKNMNDRNLHCWPSSSEPSTSRSCLMGSHTEKDQTEKQRKGWHITIHDLSGSAVAVASMVTPFVPSRGSHSVSQSSPGAWLILRPEDGAWNPWGRLEAWREGGCSDAVGYRFELFTCTDAATTLAADSISSRNGGKFSIDRTFGVSNTPGHTPNSSCDLGSGSRSRRGSSSGSGSGLEIGYGPLSPPRYRGFVVSSTVEGAGKCSKPEVEVGVRHVTCAEDAATYVALAAAMDLSMDACGLFSKKLRKELRRQWIQ